MDKNWIEDAFPEAISILDYYHVCDHLHSFAQVAFSDAIKRKKWTERQRNCCCKVKQQGLSKILSVKGVIVKKRNHL